MDPTVSERLLLSFYSFLAFLVIGLITTSIAYVRKFYAYPVLRPARPLGGQAPIGIGRLVGVILVFLAVQIVFGYLRMVLFGVPRPTDGAPSGAQWFQMTLQLFLLAAYLIYAASFGRAVWRWLWGGSSGRAIGLGVLAVFVALPQAYVLAELIRMALLAIFGPIAEQQVAVLYMRAMRAYPLFFAYLVVIVVVVVPMCEELLFRGFLLGWLRRHLNRQPAIWLSALIFGLIHFSLAQGVANWHILPPLVLLGWYLGHLYERSGSLWAPIALHVCFNGFSTFFIAMGLEG